MIEHALALAARGFMVFPLRVGGKLPLIKRWPEHATTDAAAIRGWWELTPNANIGIFTGDLLVIDVDNKGKKRGSEEILRLELEEGLDFPATYAQVTPTGGLHYVYRTDTPVRSGVDVLARGLDIRGHGGFIVGAGSNLPAGRYGSNGLDVVDAPSWLVERCGQPAVRAEPRREAVGVDPSRAVARAVEYLRAGAPLSREGEGGDDTAYRVACRVKDCGVSREAAVEILVNHWNPRCEPPWEVEDLITKVNNAYRYGTEAPGAAAPEVQFSTTPGGGNHPFDKLNKEFSFVVKGGFLLWRTTDSRRVPFIERLSKVEFHDKYASHTMTLGDGKTKQLTDLWFRSPDRSTYDNVCFRPGEDVDPRYFNLWTGFAFEPAADVGERGEAAVQAFLEHALKNVCRGSYELFDWLIGYFAHMVQKPHEKPLVALVFRGEKGTGKNALVNCVGRLLGPHYLVTSNRRYLIGNFNGHWENCLMFVLDEAFWSGDKQAEGILKDLITGDRHLIERKGYESYTVDNLTRIVVIGNEEWLVPATHDERRFAVFDVGAGRKQDNAFFEEMRLGMEAGGYRLLLRQLLDHDISRVNVNKAPSTDALFEQKLESMGPLGQFWHECLSNGSLGSEFGEGWPEKVGKGHFRTVLGRYCRDRNIKAWQPDERRIGRDLKRLCPSLGSTKARIDGGGPSWVYVLPALEVARLEWCRYVGHAVKWDA